MAKVKKLITVINTSFYSYENSRKKLLENSLYSKEDCSDVDKSEEINKTCKKISDNNMNFASLNNDKKFKFIAFPGYRNFKRNEQDDALIYRIDSINENFYISTGLYCGIINFSNTIQLEIRTEYSDLFFKRMLNFCCGIYADIATNNKSEKTKNLYSLLIQYMFLVSLRKVAVKDIPKKYVYLKEKGYDIQGNIDIEEYVNHDLVSVDKKITYQYPNRLEIQNIVDVLYTAIQACKIYKKELPLLSNFEHRLGELYSGTRPSKRIVNNILKEKCLYNGIYSDYKRPLEYAKILLDKNDLNVGNSKSISGASGFLLDASFLWEMYLYNLLRINLTDWNIESQHEISFYNDTFYHKKNYPDFVLRNRSTGKIFIFDAKFKKMSYKNEDVDNEDIRQLHSYSYYFSLKEKDNFCGAALIYPSKEHSPNGNNIDHMFGIEDANSKFGIFSIKDPSGEETMTKNETIFINNLKQFMECSNK